MSSSMKPTPSGSSASCSGRSRRLTGARSARYAGFAQRVGLPPGLVSPGERGHPSQGASGFLQTALAAVTRADLILSELQDSMRPVEVGDPELRAGLSEVRRLLADVPRARATSHERSGASRAWPWTPGGPSLALAARRLSPKRSPKLSPRWETRAPIRPWARGAPASSCPAPPPRSSPRRRPSAPTRSSSISRTLSRAG